MTIQYNIKAGKTNMVADALSRITDSPRAQYFVLSMPNFIFLDQLRHTMSSDTEFWNLHTTIQTHPQSNVDYKIHDGFILFKNKI